MTLPHELKVLTVMTDKESRHQLHQCLSALGVQNIVHAEHGLMGLHLFQKDGPFDLVLSDFVLPEPTGLDLVVLIRNDPHWPGIPVILVSIERRELNGLPREVGAVACLNQPLSERELQETLCRLNLLEARSN